MTISDSDYSDSLEVLRGHLAKGSAPSADEQRTLVELIKDSVTRLGYNTAVTTATDTMETQFGILNAFTGMDAAADIVAAIATASTAFDTLEAAVDLLGIVPTYIANTVADGGSS